MTRAAGVVGLWTSLSRVLGFVRDMVTALFLGAGFGADAFFVAFRIPNLLRRLFGEGALSAAFIPSYVETLEKHGLDRAAALARVTFTFTALVLAVVTVAGVAFSPWVVRLIAPGFFDDPTKFGLTVELNRIMFPYIFLISLVALASGVLNSLGHFAAPAAAPILLNVVMIAGVGLGCTVFSWDPAHALAWSVVIAGVAQLVMQVPFMSRSGVKLRPDFNFNQPELKRIGVLFVPAAFGGAVYQINVLIGTMLASLLPEGGVSWLYYADRLVELPLGVFAVALGTAVLPSMSRQAANGDMAGLSRSVSYSLRLTAFFTIPASVGLIVLAEPIIAVLFQRGRFTWFDTQQTAYALVCYTCGLWAFSGLKVVTQAFFSLKDTRTPLVISVLAVLVNTGAGLLLMGPMKQGGLALATALSAAFNVVALFVLLLRKLRGFPARELFRSMCRVTAASSVMAVAITFAGNAGRWNEGLTAWNGLMLCVCVFGGIAVFAAAAYLVKCTEMQSLARIILNRARGGP